MRSTSGGSPKFALGRADIAQHRVHPSKLKPNPGGFRLLVQNLAELDCRLAILPHLVGEHHAKPETGL